MAISVERDKQLYDAFIAGDKSAFEELVLLHRDNLIYFLSQYLHDLHSCEDIAQEAFAAIFVFKDRYDKSRPFKTYLYAIAKNKATDFIRKNAAVDLLGEGDLKAEDDELFNRVVKEDEKRMVHNAINMLKAEYREALLLIDINSLSYHDAALILGKTPQSMKVLIFRARQALKKQLTKGGYTYEV